MSVSPSLGDTIYHGSTVDVTTKTVVNPTSNSNPTYIATWQLCDNEMDIVAQGNADSIGAVAGFNNTVLTLHATIQLPDSLLPNTPNTYSYLIWTITDDLDTFTTTATENFVVASTDEVTYGLISTATIDSNPLPLRAVLEGHHSTNVIAKVFDPDDMLVGSVTLEPSVLANSTVYEGVFQSNNLWLVWRVPEQELKVEVNPTFDTTLHTYITSGMSQPHGYDPSRSVPVVPDIGLQPLMVQYYHESGEFIGTAEAWIINNYISGAMHEMQRSFERIVQYPGVVQSALSNIDYISFLKMGKDLFNSLERFTNFTMLKADGMVRRMWVICALYEAASSRKMEEALKAFDFSGASTTLSVDLTSAFSDFQSEMSNQIDNTVKPFKRQISARGITGGDGSDAALKGRVPYSLGQTFSSVGNAGYNLSGYPYYRMRRIDMF